MPERHIENLHEIARLIDAGDFDELRALVHPDAVLWAPEGWPERGPFRGRDAVITQYARLGEDYTDRRTVIDDIVHSGDRLVARLRWHVRARHSGIESVLETWFANRYEGDQVIETRYFWSRDEALEAAGLGG